MNGSAPPPPPPHGKNTKGPGLPNGNYDIFVIPPHSSGSGFLYLPSLQPHRNSFLAGVASTLLVVGIWSVVLPIVKGWLSTIFAPGGAGVVLLVVGVGVAGWAAGRTQSEGGSEGVGQDGAAGSANARSKASGGAFPGSGAGASWQGSGANANGDAKPTGSASANWEKAREDTRKREEERKRAAEQAAKKAEEEKTKKANAEKQKWEQMRAREKEARERDARDKTERERKLEKEIRERMDNARGRSESPRKPTFGANVYADDPLRKSASANTSPKKGYERPWASSNVGTESMYSFRPYDQPAASIFSESCASSSTSRTTPPPSQRGPFSTNDPNKIIFKGVYKFNNQFVKPVAQLEAGVNRVTDGLVLRIESEGMFIDDEVRGVGQREWDMKAWTMKAIETASRPPYHVIRAVIRDTLEGKRYIFVLPETESWKVAKGLQNLRKGSQVRSLIVGTIPASETKSLLASLQYTAL